MKKILCIALSLLLALSLCSCGSSGVSEDPVPTCPSYVTSFQDFRQTVLGAVDKASELEALFPADGDLARMTRGRAAALIGLYNELNPETPANLYRIHGQEALEQLQKNGILTREEKDALDAGSFYEVVDDLELASVMRYFYGLETAAGMTWDDPSRIGTASRISFFKGGSAALSVPMLTSVSEGTTGTDKDTFEFQALNYAATAKLLTDVITGYPAAYKADGGDSFDVCIKKAGLSASDVGAVTVELSTDGVAVWIGGCGRRHGGCYVVTASPTLRVRSTASTKGKVLGTLANGLRIAVFEEKDGWGRVSYEGKEGWISLEYADLTVPAAG